MKTFLLSLSLLTFYSCLAQQPAPPEATTDPRAERMLLYQRDNGGWPQYDGDATDYTSELATQEATTVRQDKDEDDATLDDHTTTREIRYLMQAYTDTGNPAYRAAAEAGMDYLFRAQYPGGGWPQQYPDTSSYHGHITYNDKAMMDVMNLLFDASRGDEPFSSLGPDLRARADSAVQRGIACILATQYVDQDGRLTAWGAQHDRRTLAPAPARKFEPASISGSESAGIVRFLMDIPDPDERVRRAVRAAVHFLDSVSIEGYRVDDIDDPDQPSGHDRIVVADPGSTVWARFYELGTFRPIFIGRDAIIRYQLSAIENERRVGYSFYGTWPDKVIHKEYPKWEKSLEP
ncbi:pectate lyase [Lewinella sp. IMCC34183]|uniref:pectate lyase n=1 Tax=Lewinella sp. IMCC34183 TaxID=2248762 RepID=UPI000E2890E2|nr:pectate lyase [Lewinella sp. IMCC34183]